MDALIEIRDLCVEFRLREGTVNAVNGVSLSIPPHRTLGVVGESGCGKSITAKAIMQILPPRARITQGRILLAPRDGGPFDGTQGRPERCRTGAAPRDLAALHPDSRAMRAIRGADIAMIFQEPMTSFSPVHTIGNQIIEAIRLHQHTDAREARRRAIAMLRLVRVPMPERRVDAFPHELSGGLRQRCMIAMALSCHPRLLIADEPTTALDVTIQAQILDLIQKLQQELDMAVLLITHDLSVVAERADAVAVMYLGRIVEECPVTAIFDAPKHPYTHGLLASIPRLGDRRKRLASIRGSIADPFAIPRGCAFHPRCDRFMPGVCDAGPVPPLEEVSDGHRAACFLYPECRAALDRAQRASA